MHHVCCQCFAGMLLYLQFKVVGNSEVQQRAQRGTFFKKKELISDILSFVVGHMGTWPEQPSTVSIFTYENAVG